MMIPVNGSLRALNVPQTASPLAAHSATSHWQKSARQVLPKADIQWPRRKWLQCPRIGHSNKSHPPSGNQGAGANSQDRGATRSPQAQLENEGGCRGSAPARRRHRWAYPSAACAASNIRRPSVPPWASSISRSGWGIMPSTLPASLRMPAMARAEPLTGSA